AVACSASAFAWRGGSVDDLVDDGAVRHGGGIPRRSRLGAAAPRLPPRPHRRRAYLPTLAALLRGDRRWTFALRAHFLSPRCATLVGALRDPVRRAGGRPCRATPVADEQDIRRWRCDR